MKFSDILVVPKMSKYEWDMLRYRLSPKQLISKYKKDGVDVRRIIESHERQAISLKLIRRIFSSARFASRATLNWEMSNRAKVIISLGGDNHFQYVSHFAQKSLMVGVNSDPIRSDGALITFTPEDLDRISRLLEKGNFGVEEWTRLQISLNGKKIRSLAVSEIFIGEVKRADMSRYHLIFGKRDEVQKCSGLLVATGAGSTGWYDSACRYLFHRGKSFPKTSRNFNFVATEPYHGRLSHSNLLHGTLREGKELKISSLNDSNGVLVIDALEEHEFREGSVAVIRMGMPLRVLKLKTV
jgi:NAD kinase